jgi:hypothetical protein
MWKVLAFWAGIEILALACVVWMWPAAPAAEATQPAAAATLPAPDCDRAAEEVVGALLAQPDVAGAELRYFRDGGLLVVVSIDWACPTPPPAMRLETVARWTASLFPPCQVHVLDGAGRRCEFVK